MDHIQALRTIAEYPVAEQDDMQAANMRKIAIDALSASAERRRPAARAFDEVAVTFDEALESAQRMADEMRAEGRLMEAPVLGAGGVERTPALLTKQERQAEKDAFAIIEEAAFDHARYYADSIDYPLGYRRALSYMRKTIREQITRFSRGNHEDITQAATVNQSLTDRAARTQAPAAAGPVAWRHTNRLGGVQVFTTEPPPGLKERCQPLFASPNASPADALDADMFWNDDDPEMQHDSIDELLNYEICNGVLSVGNTLTLQRGYRLPNITIRITSINDNACDAEYETIDAAMAAQGTKP